jgi:hypothetical protein
MDEGIMRDRTRSLSAPWRWLLRPLNDLTEAMDAALSRGRPILSLLTLLMSAAIAWWLYVPTHELLHAAGCLLSGGEVRRLTIHPIYGGTVLSAILPFVEGEGAYAGRLTAFSTGRSDLRYLVTDAAPFILTIAAGVPLLRLAARRPSPALTGAAAVLALAPFISLTGDYYEMGSILVTRAASFFAAPSPFEAPPEPGDPASGLMRLRSDDLFALAASLASAPRAETDEIPGGPVGATLLTAAGAVVGLSLVVATYGAGSLVSDRLLHAVPAARSPRETA